ncbi:MAG: hypothetical protein Q7J98_07050 [Kiritimatiellia bacterium]|nr:hypothetical protein [Kiritimatiellia bacterium]
MNPRETVKVQEGAGRIVMDSGAIRLEFKEDGAPEGSFSGFPTRVELREGEQWQPVMVGPPSVKFIADREYMSREEFEKTGLPPSTLWSFGLGGHWDHASIWADPKADPKTKGKMFNRYAEEEKGDPQFWVKWHDWNDRIKRGVDYSKYFSGPVKFTVEERGPVRAVVYFERPGDGQEGEIGYSGRIYLSAGAKQFGVELTVHNYEEFIEVPPQNVLITNTKHIREFRLGLKPAFGVKRVEFGLDGEKFGRDLTEDDAASPRLLQEDRQEASIKRHINGQNIARVYKSGERGAGWISISGEGRSLALGLQYFSEIYPKALEYNREARQLYVDFWPAEAQTVYHFAPGRIRTYEFEIGFDRPAEAVAAAARSPLRPYAGAEYYSRSGAAHLVLPIDDPAFPSFSQYVKKSLDRFRGEQLLYGDLHFGDQPGWSKYSAVSGYHGVGNELFMFYLSTGDPEIFRLAEAVVKHSNEIDCNHWGKLAGEHAKQHTRNQIHMSAKRMGSIGVWNFGDVDYYFLTGKRRVLAGLRQTIGFLLNQGGVMPGTFTNERATALPFRHLTYMYEAVGDERAVTSLYPNAFITNVYPYRTDSMGPELSQEVLRRLQMMTEHMEKIYTADDVRHVPFMISYAVEGLYRFWRLTGDETARKMVMQCTEYLYCNKDNVLPTGVLRYSGDRGSHLQKEPELYWYPFYDEVDLPGARAYQVSGNRRYLEYAAAPLDWRFRLLGIAYSTGGFGSTIPSTLWVMREAGMTEADLGLLRSDIDYDKALAEVSEVIKKLPPEKQGSMMLREGARVLINRGRLDEAEEWLHRVTRKKDKEVDEALLRRLEEARKRPAKTP